jgi:hypothetical protein
MIMKKQMTKLTLSRETVRNLETKEMKAAGGLPNNSYELCPTEAYNCLTYMGCN